MNRSIKDKRSDLWQGEIKLDNERIKRVKTIKYLEVEIDDLDKKQNPSGQKKKIGPSSMCQIESAWNI